MNTSQTASTVVKLNDKLIEITWNDGNTSEFHPIWLRDNCRCDECGDPAIGYRSLRLTSLDLNCKPEQLIIADSNLLISWQDGHESSFAFDWLREHAYQDSDRQAQTFKPTLWNDDFRHNPPIYEYNNIANDERKFYALMEQVRDSGLAFIRHSPAEEGIVEQVALRLGFPQESNFGRIQNLVFDPKKRSIAFDVKALKPHTDEPYRASPPGLLLFHCIANDQTGAGSSTFMDGFEIAERLRRHDPEGFSALCHQPQAFRRYYEDNVDLIAEFPMLSVDEFGNFRGVRINDRVAAPIRISPEQTENYYRGLKYLLQQSEDESLALNLTLQPGDIAIFDNHRVLHGRTDLTVDGKRWLQWAQIERGDFHSNLRILADKLGLPRDNNPLMRGAYGSSIRNTIKSHGNR